MPKDIGLPTVAEPPKMVTMTRTEVYTEATLIGMRKTYLATIKDCIKHIEEIDQALHGETKCGCNHG
jgi:hypothetical protein